MSVAPRRPEGPLPSAVRAVEAAARQAIFVAAAFWSKTVTLSAIDSKRMIVSHQVKSAEVAGANLKKRRALLPCRDIHGWRLLAQGMPVGCLLGQNSEQNKDNCR